MKKESNPYPTFKKPPPPPAPPNKKLKESEIPTKPLMSYEDLGCSYPLPPPYPPPPKRIISEDVRMTNIIKGVKKMIRKRLSKWSTTKFKVKNIDHPFLMEALSHYEQYINIFKDGDNPIIPYNVVKKRSDSLYHTFKVKDEK